MKKNRRSGVFVLSLTLIAAIVVIVTYASDFAAGGIESNADFSPRDYDTAEMEKDMVYQGKLILINGSNPCRMLEKNQMSPIFDLKNSSYQVKDAEVMANREAIEALNEMLGDFKSKTGKDDVNIISGYRGVELQTELFDEKKEETNEAEAMRWVARPGYSEHHSGYALDFGIYRDGASFTFDGNGRYRWIEDHAHEYGFILRYAPEKEGQTGIAGETWHFRYVGRPHAFFMKQKKMCMEEYIEFLKAYSYQNKHLNITDFDGKKYEVYYVKAEAGKTSVPIPKKAPYTVSGNNVDGFIVTAELK